MDQPLLKMAIVMLAVVMLALSSHTALQFNTDTHRATFVTMIALVFTIGVTRALVVTKNTMAALILFA